jgi:alpha-beta hydrolase superfamily lysophospholipase
MIQTLENRLPGIAGITLHYYAWLPETPPVACVAIAHGIGSHGGAFANVGEIWAAQGIAVYALDFRGHGLSEGQRGYIKAWSELVADIHCLLGQIRAEYPDVPLFLWGHSLGGAVAMDVALQDAIPLNGLLLIAPAMGVDGISPIKIAIGKLFSRIWPRLSLKTGIDKTSCSRAPELVTAYYADPLHHDYGSARMATEFLRAIARIKSQVGSLQLPVLILHGSADRTTKVAGSEALFAQLTMTDKILRIFPEALHELHLELNREEILAGMIDWIKARASGRVLELVD